MDDPPCPRCGKPAPESTWTEFDYRCEVCQINFGYSSKGNVTFSMNSESGDLPEMPHFQETYDWKFKR